MSVKLIISPHWKLLTAVALAAAVAIIALFLPTTTARLVFLIPLAVFAVVTCVMTLRLALSAAGSCGLNSTTVIGSQVASGSGCSS